MTRPNLLILVPARGGSKRLPGKNLLRLAGKPLLAHTAEAIAASGLDAPVVLSTDDDAIAREGERLGWLVPFRRPAELAADAASTLSVVLHALAWHAGARGGDPNAIMVLQPTSPLRGGACLRTAVETLERRSDVQSIIGMTPLHLPPARMFRTAVDGTARPLIEDDGRRPVYVPNGALFLARTEAMRRQNTLYARPVLPLVLDAARGLDIDTETDLRLAEALLTVGLPPETAHPAAGAAVDGVVA